MITTTTIKPTRINCWEMDRDAMLDADLDDSATIMVDESGQITVYDERGREE
jgi:hypothetical protein